MAFTPYHNITGSTGVDIELIATGEGVNNIRSIIIVNTHDTADAEVSLFIQNNPTAEASSTFHIMHTVAIPADTSLLLGREDIPSFNNSKNGYGLYLKVGSSDTLDVMINR